MQGTLTRSLRVRTIPERRFVRIMPTIGATVLLAAVALSGMMVVKEPNVIYFPSRDLIAQALRPHTVN